MIIRAWKKQDNAQVAVLEQQCFKSPWSIEMLNSQLELENFYGLVAECDGEIVGYIGSICDNWDSEILNIAVSGNMRRRGIAKSLMSSVIDYYKCQGKENMFLEVRVSNEAAKSLYTLLGFEPIGIRKKYYENTEDAIVMRKVF